MNLLKLVTALSGYEGFRPEPYMDTKRIWTVAKGINLEGSPLTGAEYKYLLDSKHLLFSISEEGADWLLKTRIQKVAVDLARQLYYLWPKLNDARQDALIMIAYQLGVGGVMGFHDMLAAVKDERWADAEQAGLDSDWAKETPGRATKVLEQLRSGVE